MKVKRYTILKNTLIVILKDGSKIWFEFCASKSNNFLEEIKIVKVEGRVSFKTVEEQIIAVYKVMEKFGIYMYKKYDSIKKIAQVLKENNDLLRIGIKEEEIDKLFEEVLTPEEKDAEESKIEANIEYLVKEDTREEISEDKVNNNKKEEDYYDNKSKPKTKKRKR